MFPFVKQFSCNPDITIFAKGVQQKQEIFSRRLGSNEALNVIECPNRLAGEPRGDQPANKNEEGGGAGADVVLVHLDNELPSDVELADFAEDVDEKVVGGGCERRGREGLGKVEEGKGNFGRVPEAQEGLVKKVSGERNAVELERGLHGVEGVVVMKKDFGHQIGVV